MTMSDSDLQGRLRDLRCRSTSSRPRRTTWPSARGRATARSAVAARSWPSTGLVAALVLVGVPVGRVRSAGVRCASGDTAEEPVLPVPDGGLYDVPTRGSLADDRAWVAGVRALDWPPADGEVPSTADRRVVFAGEVPGGRVALVLGRLARGTARLWLVGPEGAAPGEMRPAPLAPARAARREAARPLGRARSRGGHRSARRGRLPR